MAELTDDQWERVKPHLPPPAPGREGRPPAGRRPGVRRGQLATSPALLAKIYKRELSQLLTDRV